MRRVARQLLRILAVTAAVAPSTRAEALTSPIAGAVALPAGVQLLLPIPAGNRMTLLSGYGPNGGSSLHADTDDCCKANDHYALDLIYTDEPNGGLGLPLVAPLPGVVVKAGWATAGWANYGQRVILRHDLGDGSVYHTLYAHMNAIAPEIVEGAMVAQGQVLGELGRSCQNELACSSFSAPHLHFAMHRDSTVGGSGTGGSYGGNAVVPEPFDGAEDLGPGDVITSSNVEMVACGDGVCSQGETSDVCIVDCPRCEPVPPEGRVIDESEICFTRGGTESYWHLEASGFGNSLLYTITTDDPAPDNFGNWRIEALEAGRYRVEAHTPAPHAQSRQAGYQVRHAGSTEVVRIDQMAIDGFAELGAFDFAADGDEWIRLDDNTGEPVSENRRLVFDAVRLTRIGIDDTDAGSIETDAETGMDVAPTKEPSDAAMPDDAADRESVPIVEQGCGCGTVSSHASLRRFRWPSWIQAFFQ